MNVVKIGGSTLRTNEDFRLLAERLVQEYAPPTLVVVSALPRVTRQLEAVALQAQQRKLDEAVAALERIVADHWHWAQALITASATRAALSMLLDELRAQTERFVRGVALTGELTPRTLDRIVSIGERMALHLIHHFLLECGLDVVSLPATELIVTDEVHTNAQPLLEATRRRIAERLQPQLARFAYVLTEGFVGRSASGEITTMGKESSALTAAVLAQLLAAQRLVLLTPVAGVHSADPEVVHSARPIEQLSYDQADSLAHLGLKLLYPTMIAPLRSENIELCITSLDRGSHGSVISTSARPQPQFIVITGQSVWCQVSESDYTMALARGWRHRGKAFWHRATVSFAVNQQQLLYLQSLGVEILSVPQQCQELCVWLWAEQPDIHANVEQVITRVPQRFALSVMSREAESILCVLTWSLESQMVVALHDALGEHVWM